MDRVMMSGVHMTEQFQVLFICACLRLAAAQESAAPPADLAIAALTDFPGAPVASGSERHREREIAHSKERGRERGGDSEAEMRESLSAPASSAALLALHAETPP